MRGEKIKVGILVTSLRVGGAEMDIVRNIPEMDRTRFEAVVINISDPGPLAEDLIRKGIRVVARLSEPPSPRPSNPSSWVARAGTQLWKLASIPAILLWIARMFRKERLDIAHFFLPHAYILGMMACLARPKIRRVMSRLVSNVALKKSPFTMFLEQHLMHRFVHIGIGNCRLILRELEQEGMAAHKTRLLYNGIDPSLIQRQRESRRQARESLGISQETFVMVGVGNLHHRKRYDDLIGAAALAAQRLARPWIILVAGGQGDQAGNREQYEALLEQYQLRDHFRFLGLYPNVKELLFAADLFVHPSEEEGFPNAILEAMTASLPVIGCPIGGIPEQILDTPPDQATGWLVPTRNPEALSRAIVEAASNADRLEILGERARQRVLDHFSLEKSVSAYEAIYAETMPNAR